MKTSKGKKHKTQNTNNRKEKEAMHGRKRTKSGDARPNARRGRKKARANPMHALGATANNKVIKNSADLSYVSTQLYNGTAITNVTDDTFARPTNLPATGTNFQNRLGNKIHGKYLWLRGAVNFAGAGKASQCRLVVVYDKNSNGALPNFNDIMLDTDAAGSTASDIYAKRNRNTVDRYITLMDKTFSITDDYTPKPYVEEYIKLHGLQTTFSGSTSAITSVSTGAILVYAISTRAAGDDPPTLDMRCTYCFTDK